MSPFNEPNNTNSTTLTYWPISPFNGYTQGNQYGWSSGTTINTVTVTTTGSSTSPGAAIPDFKESEVGRLRRSVADLCVEGRLALEAA